MVLALMKDERYLAQIVFSTRQETVSVFSFSSLPQGGG